MTPYGNAGGLLGLDDEQLKKLIAQFGATPELKRGADSDGLLAFGLGLMANARKGREIEGVGQAGMGALVYRDQSLDRRVKEQGQALAQGMGALKLGKESAMIDAQMRMMNGDEGGAPGAAPGGSVSDAMRPPGPGGTPAPQNLTKLTLMQRATNLGVAEPVRLALAGGGPEGWRKAADIIADASKPHFGQGVNPITRDVNTGNFVVNRPVGMTDIQAEQAGAVERAKQQAAAENELVEVKIGNQTIQMTRAEAVRRLSGGASGAKAPTTSFKFAPGTGPNAEQMGEIQKDMRGEPSAFSPATPGAPNAPVLGVSGDPVQRRAAEEAIVTAEQGKRTAQTSRAANSERMYDGVRQQYIAAREMAPHLANMEQLDASGVFSGPVGALSESAANWINSAFPDANVSGEKLANAQTYRSEISRMQQAIAKSFPGSQSDKELAALTQSLPDLMLSPQGRAQVRNVLARKVKDSEASYDSASEFYNKNDSLIGWKPPTYTAPAEGFAPPKKAETKEAPAGANSVTAPNGKTYNFPSAAAANAFRKKFNIQ